MTVKTTSVNQAVFYRRTYKPSPGTRGIAYAPGGGGTPQSFVDTSIPGNYELAKAMAEVGYPIISFASGWGWGNATNQTELGLAVPFVSSGGKAHILGGSMGGAIALNWAKANLGLVQSITLLIPAVDLQDIHANNRGGYAASIATAWGGNAPSDANNPADNAASFTGIPVKAWYSDDDPICVASTITTFCQAAGGEAVSLGAIGHSISTLDTDEVLTFLDENS